MDEKPKSLIINTKRTQQIIFGPWLVLFDAAEEWDIAQSTRSSQCDLMSDQILHLRRNIKERLEIFRKQSQEDRIRSCSHGRIGADMIEQRGFTKVFIHIEIGQQDRFRLFNLGSIGSYCDRARATHDDIET